MQRIPVRRGITVLALAALAACDTTRSTSAPDPASRPEEIRRQVEAMGFRGDMIRDFGEYVVVEGDIMITKAHLRSTAPRRSNNPMGPRFQYHTTSLVGSPKVQQITVNLSGLNSEPGWQSAARDAMAHWNAVSGSYVRLTESSSGDIYVGTNCDLPDNFAALASWPSGGNPGPTIHVNPCFQSATSHAQKVHNMVHEFGHTLGLRHSNYVQMGEGAGTQGAVRVSGTPSSGNDPGSVMNGGTALNSWAGFSAADITAVRYLYPLPAVFPVSVTDSGGNPLVSWGAVLGATSYTVRFVLDQYWEDGYGETFVGQSSMTVGTTSGTGLVDPNQSYTGATRCIYPDEGSTYYTYYFTYQVLAHFPNGTSVRSVDAPVGDCG